MSEEEKIKDTFTAEELLAEIRKTEPDYNPVSYLHKPDISNLIPLSWCELKKMEVPATEYVIYPFLPTQGICFIYAAAGIGKTLFTLNLAYAIAGGGNFLKYTCPKPRKVLYIDAEMAFNQIMGRLFQIEQNQGELDFEENIMLLTPDKVKPARLPKIDDPFGQEAYNAIIEKGGYEVIVLDNLATLSCMDENKTNEWVKIQDWLLSLRANGKTVIVVHHAGKDKNGYRGTSRLLDCADTAISLQPLNDDHVDDGSFNQKKFKIVYQKARAFGGKESMPFEVILEGGLWSHRSIELSTLDKVIECLNAKMTQRDIAKELFISQSTVNRLIKKARMSGRVQD